MNRKEKLIWFAGISFGIHIGIASFSDLFNIHIGDGVMTLGAISSTILITLTLVLLIVSKESNA
jgi:hypothetical protein